LTLFQLSGAANEVDAALHGPAIGVHNTFSDEELADEDIALEDIEQRVIEFIKVRLNRMSPRTCRMRSTVCFALTAGPTTHLAVIRDERHESSSRLVHRVGRVIPNADPHS
jgi:hypothetical protein